MIFESHSGVIDLISIHVWLRQLSRWSMFKPSKRNLSFNGLEARMRGRPAALRDPTPKEQRDEQVF
jgi:hypothetical protein